MASIGETGPLLDRLGDKFTVGDDCWQWTGYLSKWGYGALRVGGHEFTEENTYIGKTRLGNQSRVCRACHAAHARERRRQWQA